MDINSVLEYAGSAALAAATAAIPTLTLQLMETARAKKKGIILQKIISFGGDIAYHAMVAAQRTPQANGKLNIPLMEKNAIEAGVSAVKLLPYSMVASMNDQELGAYVRSGLGAAYKVDPTTSATGSSTAVASAPPGEVAEAKAGGSISNAAESRAPIPVSGPAIPGSPVANGTV